MLSLLEEKMKLRVESVVTWPVRWKGNPWPDGLALSDGDMPLDADSRPLPCIEAEISGFSPQRSPGNEGHRRTTAEGFLRMFLSVGQHSGDAGLSAQYDLLDTGLARKNVYYDSLTATRIYLMDVRVVEGIGFYEENNRTVRTLQVPWFCFWFS